MDALIFGNALMEKSFHSYQKISPFFSLGKEQALLYHEKKGIKSNKNIDLNIELFLDFI